MFRLVVVSPDGDQKIFDLDRPEYIVGREVDSDIELKDRKISRKHARIFFRAGAYWIEDLGSQNGVLENDRLLTAPRKLTCGQVFSLGGFSLQLESEAAPVSVFFLVGRDEQFLGQRIQIPLGRVEIGRTEDNSIVVPDPSVSRRQAMLEVTHRTLVLEDLESGNGTFVNGVQIGRRQLKIGDVLKFGRIEFELGRDTSGLNFDSLAAWFKKHIFKAAPKRFLSLLGAVGFLAFLGVFLALVGQRCPTNNDFETAGGLPKQAFEQAVEKGLADARGALAQENWARAEHSFKSVLERDPVNSEARRGLVLAQARQEDQNNILAAQADLKNNKPPEALVRLGRVDPTGPYSKTAIELSQIAQKQFAEAAFDKARRACDKNDFKECHLHAVLGLENEPNSAVGQALIATAEKVLKSRRIQFVPWALSHEESASTSPVSLETLYTTPELRNAVLRYSVGDSETALKLITSTENAEAITLAKLINEAVRQKKLGDDAAQKGDMESAINHWKTALASNEQIVPAHYPSSMRIDLRQRLGDELFRQGDRAFLYEHYSQALNFWLSALEFKPLDPDVLGGLVQLESRAKKILADFPERKTLSVSDCERLKALNLTIPPKSSLAQIANERLNLGCPKKANP